MVDHYELDLFAALVGEDPASIPELAEADGALSHAGKDALWALLQADERYGPRWLLACRRLHATGREEAARSLSRKWPSGRTSGMSSRIP